MRNAPPRVALRGAGRNGTFTKHLLANMRLPGIEVGPMMRKVRAGVQQETGGKQTPWELSSLTGEFYFSGDKNAVARATTSAHSAGVSRHRSPISSAWARPIHATGARAALSRWV